MEDAIKVKTQTGDLYYNCHILIYRKRDKYIIQKLTFPNSNNATHTSHALEATASYRNSYTIPKSAFGVKNEDSNSSSAMLLDGPVIKISEEGHLQFVQEPHQDIEPVQANISEKVCTAIPLEDFPGIY